MPNLLATTDGELELRQGRDWSFSVEVLDENTDEPQAVADPYTLEMQVRASVGSTDVLIDCSAYATAVPGVLKANVIVPGGVTAALSLTADFVDWIADAKFVKDGSSPVSAEDAGRFTVHVLRQVTR